MCYKTSNRCLKISSQEFYNDTKFFSEFFKVVVTPESDVLDIGVNFGLHTNMFLNLTKGNIYAFDASPGIFPITDSIYKNQLYVKLFNVSVTNFDGVVEFGGFKHFVLETAKLKNNIIKKN
jgi:hypothetical protein